MKKIVSGILALLILFAVIAIVKTMQFTSPNVVVAKIEGQGYQGEGEAERLATALSFPTVTHQDRDTIDFSAFDNFHGFLRESFPLVFSSLEQETVSSHSLLMTWTGTDPGLKPILFMAHQDVVPVLPDAKWTHPPFEGLIKDGYIWGRGALDDKSSMMGILEAVETLLKEGFQPPRSVYLAFGQDEEIGGQEGAAKIARLLESRNLSLEYVLDEGGMITKGILGDGMAAMIGVAEKGYVSLALTARGDGGHSSMPPPQTAVGILSKAIAQLEASPFPANINYLRELTRNLGPDAPFAQRLVMANTWATSWLIESGASKERTTNAMIRTTTAATMFNGSSKDNVLPVVAQAVVNFRIIPGETAETVTAYVKKIIDDPRVEVDFYDAFYSNPSPVSNTQSASYRLVRETIHQVAGNEKIVVAPYLTVGATDSRYFTQLTDNVYRFLFNIMESDDIARIHGADERVSLENYKRTISFYYQLLRNTEKL